MRLYRNQLNPPTEFSNEHPGMLILHYNSAHGNPRIGVVGHTILEVETLVLNFDPIQAKWAVRQGRVGS